MNQSQAELAVLYSPELAIYGLNASYGEGAWLISVTFLHVKIFSALRSALVSPAPLCAQLNFCYTPRLIERRNNRATQ